MLCRESCHPKDKRQSWSLESLLLSCYKCQQELKPLDGRVGGSSCQPVSKKSAAARLFLKNTEQTLLLWCFSVPNSLFSCKKKETNSSRLKHKAVCRAKYDDAAQTRAPFPGHAPKTSSHCIFLICFSCTSSKWLLMFRQLHSDTQWQKKLSFSSFCPILFFPFVRFSVLFNKVHPSD